jgi:hypothetical protein
MTQYTAVKSHLTARSAVAIDARVASTREGEPDAVRVGARGELEVIFEPPLVPIENRVDARPDAVSDHLPEVGTCVCQSERSRPTR